MANKAWSTFKNISRWKKVALGIFLCVSLIVLTLSLLVATQSGTRWAVEKGAGLVQIKLGQMKGNLLTGLDVSSLDYDQKGILVHAEKISFRWQPLSLFYTTVSVQSLTAENIRVQLPPSVEKPEPDNYVWPSLAQPVRVELGRTHLRNIQITQGNTKQFIDNLSGSFNLGTFHLRVKNVMAENGQAKLLVNGAMGLRYPYTLDAVAEWNLKKQRDDDLVFAGKAVAKGDIKTLHVTNDLISPVLVKATGKISPAFHDKKTKPGADVIVEWNDQTLLPVIANYFNPEGKLHFLKPVKKTRGRLALKGWLEAYDLVGTVNAKTPDATIAIDVAAKGNHLPEEQQSQLHIETLQLVTKPLDAPADANNENLLLLSGKVNWLPYIQWDLALKAEHFNIENFVAEWPSNLNIAMVSQGEYREQQLKIAFNNINASGELRNLAVSAEGEIHSDNNLWNSSNFKLAIGANQLVVKGQAGKDLAVDWKIDAPLLGQIDPSVSGSVISSGSLKGNIAKPTMQIDAQVNKFSWRNYAVENLTLKLTSLASTDKYNLALDANQVIIAGQQITYLSLKSNGNIEQHNVLGQIDSANYGNVNFVLDSSWKDNLWRGQWREFRFNTKKIPSWSLLSSTPMQVDKQHAELGKLCLTTNNELPFAIDTSPAAAKQDGVLQTPSICAAGNWGQTGGVTVNIAIQSAPLSSLRAWFKPEVTLSGALEGDLNFRAPVNTPATMTANLQTRDAKLLYQFQGGNVETYPLQKGSINAALKNNQLNASMLMDWASYGALTIDTQYAVTTEKINGTASIALTNLAPLEGLLPFLNNVQGAANGKFNFVGTPKRPEITGNFSITNGSANLPKLGLELKNISFQVNSTAVNSAHVEGAITSGDGTLVTQGDFVNLGSPDWHWQANVFGAGIRIIQQTQLTATISPNLKVKANAQSIELTGSTEIPWARAVIKNLPESATRVSNDVVVVENDSVSLDGLTKKTLPFHTNVILYFGDDVRFKGFGLDTRLSGKANVIKEENRQVFTTGYVAVDKGIYKAYGQELSIERGRLIFQGPYDNPGLDIRALRVMEDVTAGLDIGGTLQHPKSTVFSIPASTDSEAMAMLLTGKPLSNSSKDDAYAILGAIGKLGMSQGDSMSSDIIQKFGLDEVSIKADKGLEQSALWVGKNVTPKLFLHYVVGLFDQAFSLGLTYKLNDKINIEAESGKEQSVDVIYKIER
ncbi:MAG: hypothetical protein EOO52_16445 [Gammaproteobacteria bacterium]|nr:MAG: hypothetical protein EOO52_16445 [Gammaproteobacteria bacterium]